MTTNFEKVKEFMSAMEQTVRDVPTEPTIQESVLRKNLIAEEFDEFDRANFLLQQLRRTLDNYIKTKEEVNNVEQFTLLLQNRKENIYQEMKELFLDLNHYDLVESVKNLTLIEFLLGFETYYISIQQELLRDIGDALCDLLVVVYGGGHTYGLDLDAGFEEVHRSNMSKLGEDGKPIKRENDGKVLKGPNYFPPNLIKVFFDN